MGTLTFDFQTHAFLSSYSLSHTLDSKPIPTKCNSHMALSSAAAPSGRQLTLHQAARAIWQEKWNLHRLVRLHMRTNNTTVGLGGLCKILPEGPSLYCSWCMHQGVQVFCLCTSKSICTFTRMFYQNFYNEILFKLCFWK